MNSPGVSIVICTYNGKKNLDKTLEHVAAQKSIKGINIELLVVDNGSKDGTAQFVENHWQSLQAPFKLNIISEPSPGKANASYTGFNNCSYETIIVCDDDNWLCDEYVKTAYDYFAGNKSIGVMGGRGEPVFEGSKPDWFDKQQNIFAVGEQFGFNGKQLGSVWGAGMVFRKSAWDKIVKLEYRFLLNEQRSGNLNWGGDDIELCEMVKMLGYELWYDNKLTFKHYIPKQRLHTNYLHSRYFGLGRSRLYLQAYQYCQTHNDIPLNHLNYPLWIDRYIHKTKERLQFFPRIIFKINNKVDDDVLKYIALKGELYELCRIKDGYTQIFNSILYYKTRIAELKK